MIDGFIYNKLSNDANITAIVGTSISAEYRYDNSTLPFIAYYDISEIYEKYNRVRSCVKSIKIMSETKLEVLQILEEVIRLFNSGISETYLTNEIVETKVINSITRLDDGNNCWISTADINIIYK